MADNPEQSSRDGSTREARDYFQTQRNALRELLELASDVVTPLEEDIERRLQESQKTAEQALAEVRSQIESRFQKKQAEAEHSYAELVEQAEAQYESARDTIAARTHESREGFAAQAREIEKQARREREDDLLMAETVFQSTIEGLRKDFGALKRDLATRGKRLDTLRQQATRILDEHRCQAPGDAGVSDGEPVKLEDPAAAYEQHARAATKHLAALRELSMPPMSIGAGPFLLLALLNLAPIGALSVLSLRGVAGAPPLLPWGPIALGVTLIASWIIGRALRQRARARLHTRIRRTDKPFRLALAAAGLALDQHLEHASQQLKRDEAETTERRDQETEAVHASFDTLMAETDRRRGESLQRLDATTAEQQNGIQRRHDSILGQAAGQRDNRLRRYRERRDHDLAAAQQRCDQQLEAARRRHASERSTLEARWKTGLAEIRQLLEDVDRLKRLPHVDWNAGLPVDWVAPQEFKAFIPFGHWHIDLANLAPSVRGLAPFLDDHTAPTEVPALLAIPTRCSLFLQTERAGRQEAIDTLRAVMLCLLTSLPPGRVHFTILDPVGLGENFAGFMHLVDYEEKLVGGRIWTESEHIEARLTELTSHMENVIQKYLRNEFATIDEYNAQAGELVEPYRFLVIADFPANFNEGAARRLTSIVNSGARCGVFTLIAHDQRLPTPAELHIEDLAGESTHLVYENDHFVYQDDVLRQFPLTLDTPPSEETLTSILHVVGRHAKDSLRVEVPFESVAPGNEQCWANDSRGGISMPLGHTGAVRLQNLRLGRGLAQHALIAGKTGSGKSTLLHVIITNLALWYSPDEVELYLVDFKKGVEFKTYVTHQLPHARAIAVESDREFGVSVLQRLDAELARRGDLFRAAGVQDLPAYREATGERLPRTLLIVDEFQVFFAEDDRLSQDAALLLDRLVRQGRAFGIHVLLGSQTLGGASSLARSTIGQMAVRIALQCSEADSQLILDDTNVAARLLSRPGEAIYNDAGGLVEGNSPFQTAWLPDQRRQVYLQRVRDLARQRKVRVEPAVVFEGNAPADIRQNRLLASIIESADWPKVPYPRAWLGEAVAIKDPSNVAFKRQSGANLLFIGQRDAAVASMLAATIVSLGAQYASDAARLIILETRPVDAGISGQLNRVAATLPHESRFIAWRDVADTITELAHEVQRRVDADQTDAPAVYLLINGLHRYRMLRRQEDDFSFSNDDTDRPPALDKQLADVLRDGPPFGVHTIAWCDTLASLERTLDRQSIGEFDNRVLFQMSAADSANLIDTPEANKLGFYRALLCSVEHGLIEKLRPYATLDAEWLQHVTRCFQRKRT
jgi:hypothetical protein